MVLEIHLKMQDRYIKILINADKVVKIVGNLIHFKIIFDSGTILYCEVIF